MSQLQTILNKAKESTNVIDLLTTLNYSDFIYVYDLAKDTNSLLATIKEQSENLAVCRNEIEVYEEALKTISTIGFRPALHGPVSHSYSTEATIAREALRETHQL